MYSRFLIGVCSYLLIGYYSHRLSAVKSAQKAILVNRISDGLLMWGILWIWYHLGSLEYDMLNVYSASGFVGLPILIGAMGKSVQILFHVWLPDSMEGPTPVSALIHAATLVTAGVYLLVRLHIHDETFLIIVGSLTAFMAGIFGATQSDIKRVIAFSTCSQLGYPFLFVFILFLSCFYFNSDLMLLSYDISHSFVTYSYCVTICSNKKKDIIPTNYVDRFVSFQSQELRLIKQSYKHKAVIYMWYNSVSGKAYVGRTINLCRRLENYFSNNYIAYAKKHMPICAVLFKYSYSSFELYVLEVVSKDNIENLPFREYFWISIVNPSYNLAAAVDTFKGKNHPRYGKSVPQDVRDKISEKLTGRKLSLDHKHNISLGQKKKEIFCVDVETNILVVKFESMRGMCRILNLSSTILIIRKLDKQKPFTCIYNGQKVVWHLYSQLS